MLAPRSTPEVMQLGPDDAPGDLPVAASPVVFPADAASPVPRRVQVSRRRLEAQTKTLAALVAASVIAMWPVVTGVAPSLVFEPAALAFMVFLLADITLGQPSRWSAMLPLTSVLLRFAHPAAAGVVSFTVITATSDARVSPAATLAACVAAVLTAALGRHWRAATTTRVAIVGTSQSAIQLRLDMQDAAIRSHVLVGVVLGEADLDAGAEISHETLGRVSSLDALITDHAIDLVLVDKHERVVEVFDQLADTCLHLPVRVCELPHFYEDVLGRVLVSDIDTAWFRYIMHPRFHAPADRMKRALDVAVALIALIVFAPVMLVSAALIKLHDGGPVLFSQRRIGNHGRAFTLYKLRTMTTGSIGAQWTSADDPRVTPSGRWMRRAHVDELPQLLNILRGEMTLVGPRPEQPEFVDRLERQLPHYNRRHLIKPGLTGWAQVRFGYAGSDSGSARKLCFDLFYLKHRSLGLDVAILAETARTLFGGQRVAPPVESMREAAGIHSGI